MVTLIIIGWFLIGFATSIGMFMLDGGNILRKDVAMACVFSFLGPVGLLALLVTASFEGIARIGEHPWWDKPVWKRK